VTTHFTYTFAAAGTFVVRLTVDTAAGVSDTETVTLVITDPEITVTADFTASDTTLDAGQSATFTNTSSASGTTITAYTWTIVADGSAAVYETEDITHTFGQAGVYEVGLTLMTAAGVTAAKSITVTVRAVDSYGAGLYKAMIVPYRVAVATATGEQTITTAALGTLVPKGATVRLTAAVTDGTAANGALWAEGATDGASQWAMVRYAQDGVTPTAGRRRFKSGVLLQTISETGAVTGEAVFARFVAGGMVINVTDAFPAAYLMEIDFYAGDDVTVACGTALIGALGIDTTVTTGFAADFIYAASTWALDDGTAQTDGDMSRGFALAAGTQMCFRQQDRNAVATTALNTRHSGSYVGFSGDGSTGTNVFIQAREFTATGFKLRPYTNSMADRPMGWLAVALGGPSVSLATVALGTGATSTHGLAFNPQAVLALVATTATADAAVTDTSAEGQGYYATSIYSSGAEYTTWIAAADGAGTSDTSSWSDNAFRAIDHDGSNEWNGVGALADGEFEVTWTNAPGAAHLMILLAAEVAEALPEDPPADPPPTADFTADVRSGTTRLLVRFDSSATNDNGEAITAWLWEFGDGTTSDAPNPAHLYSREGEFDVTLTVTNANGVSTVTKETYIVAAHPKRKRGPVGPIRPRSITSSSGNDMPLDYTGDDENDAQVGYHTHAPESVPSLALLGMSSEEIAARAAETDGTHVLLCWNYDTNEITVIDTDGTIRKAATTT
jgi:PKD repeat protein